MNKHYCKCGEPNDDDEDDDYKYLAALKENEKSEKN